MANQEHLDILARGVEAWNAWRAENPEIQPDLSEADLSGADLNAADLRGANLRWTYLSDVDFRGAQLRGADLSHANLRESDLSEVDLERACLRESDLSEADLSYANLRNANLRNANLRRANLSRANLSRADLRGVDLRGVDLERAYLRAAQLREANLSRAGIGSTVFVNTDLREVHGLETVFHSGPSSIGIDTLYRSAGQIPAAFLRGCGVPDSFIDYIPSLVGAMEPIQYYSCFISYSSRDEDFARRLHERMRAEHLRVWFAPEDIKGGDKLYDQIDRAIQLHDRLLLVLSEQSMQSEWVMTEIRRTRRQEIKEQRRKLFPIRLVDFDALRDWSCFDADHGKDLAVEVREYFIPDFSDWKQHDAFESAFARLLRDLRAAEAPAER